MVLLPSLTLLGLSVWYAVSAPRVVLDVLFDPARLQVVAIALAIGFVLWLVVVVSTYAMVRPAPRRRFQTALGSAFVAVLVLAVATPVLFGARYAMVQADLVETVFEDNQSATSPDLPEPEKVTEEDPWGGQERVNVLLLGGDGGVHREGVRTDTMILLSLDTRSGRTTMFSLPRNMMNAQFAAGSPLQELYPYGFTGYGDPGEWMLNAVYRNVPALHPDLLGKTDNEGADALKLAVVRQPRRACRLLPAGQPPGLPSDRGRDGRGDASTSTSRSRWAATPISASSPTATSSQAQTSGWTASTRCGSRAGATALTTTSAWSGSAA